MLAVFRIISRSYEWLLQALFPPKCCCCFRRGSVLHIPCIQFHIDCGTDVVAKIFWMSSYNNPRIKQLIERCKFFGCTSLIAPWIHAVPLQNFPADFATDTWTIVPIPLHWTRRLWRGFNQSDLIATSLQNRFSDMTVSLNLLRIKSTQQQARLSKSDRQKNIQNAFVWREKKSAPDNIILVDDVYTSGATLQEAKKTLLANGAKQVWCCVLARKFSE